MRFIDKSFGVQVARDVQYATGRVEANANPRDRPLCFDAYEPEDDPAGTLRPALIMAFGGAFHRGSKEADEFDNEGHRNTPVAQYCREFARRGYAAFSIDYRLVQEDPDPGTTPVILNKRNIPRTRVDYVRGLLGLPPATAEMLWAGMEAACDDMVNAFHFVRDHAPQYRIDPARIAIGGFSAGARTALGAAYGARVPAAAVIALSGYMSEEDLKRLVTGATGEPPVLLVTGENDLDYVAKQAAVLHHHFETVGLHHEAWTVPGATHFYPASSTMRRTDGQEAVLEDTMANFLYHALHLGEIPR